jgi:NTE family protein
MLEALVDAGIAPDLIVSASIGAVNGAVFASRPDRHGVARLRTLWERVAAEGIGGPPLARLENTARLRSGIYPQEPFRRVLEDALDADRIEDLEMPFSCVAASIERAAEQWFGEGPLIPALMASSAVPGIFPPVQIDGEHYYDGGLVNSVPLDRAVSLGAAEVYVLQVGRIEYRLAPPKRIYESALIAFEIARRHRLATLLEAPPDGVTVHVRPSGQPLAYKDPRQLRFADLGDTSELIASARTAGMAYLEEHPPRDFTLVTMGPKAVALPADA